MKTEKELKKPNLVRILKLNYKKTDEFYPKHEVYQKGDVKILYDPLNDMIITGIQG